MTRRRPHSPLHDYWVTFAAIAALATVYIIATACSTPTGSASNSFEAPTPATVDRAAHTLSRGTARPAPPEPPRAAPPTPVAPQSNGEELRGATGLPAQLICIRHLESRGDYTITNPASGASGAWQFMDSTWESVTGLPAPASQYDKATQDAAALKLWNNGAGASHWVTSGDC